YASQWDVTIEGTRRARVGRAAVILDGSNSLIRNVRVADQAAGMQAVVKILGRASYGCDHRIEDVKVDNEDPVPTVPTLGVVYAERTTAGQSVSLRHVRASVPPGVPIARLADPWPGNP